MTFAEPQTAAEIRARYRAARKALWTPRKVAVAPDPPPKTIDRQMAEALDAITVAAAPSVYRAEPAERFAITTILMACAIAGNVTMDEIRSERRQKRIIPARHVFCYLARNHTTLSFPQIGRVIGAGTIAPSFTRLPRLLHGLRTATQDMRRWSLRRFPSSGGRNDHQRPHPQLCRSHRTT